MDTIPDISAWREAFAQAAALLWISVANRLPSLAAGAAILVVGWAVAWLSGLVTRRSLRLMGSDHPRGRFGPAETLGQAGIRLAPSQVISRLIFWLVLISFVVISLEVLGVAAFNATINPVLAFLPQLTGVAFMVLLGVLLARFLGTVASSASAAAGFPNARRVGLLTQALMGGLVMVTAAEQLGVATNVLVAPLLVVLGAAGFAAGLAFALGARPIITHILAGHFLRQSLPRDGFVEVNGQRGVVDRVGPTDTLLRSDERKWSVPNGRLLEEIVVR